MMSVPGKGFLNVNNVLYCICLRCTEISFLIFCSENVLENNLDSHFVTLFQLEGCTELKPLENQNNGSRQTSKSTKQILQCVQKREKVLFTA